MPKGSKDGSVYKRTEIYLDGKGRERTRDLWFARVRYTDASGRRRELKRAAPSYALACESKRTLAAEAKRRAGRPAGSDRLTFADLAAFYKEHYVVPAEYVGGRKVAGLRSVKDAEREIGILADHFGRKPLSRLTYGDLRTFRTKRLKAPTRAGGQRAVASVNRELALLRRVLNVALREGWLERNPFTQGEPLISMADERRRERILSLDEEERLLDACGAREYTYMRRGQEVKVHDEGKRRRHLRAIVVCALDTGMRKGEILKLRWSDLDLEGRMITVRAFNTKTMRERRVAMTARLAGEIEGLRAKLSESGERDPLVFGLDEVRRSFAGACSAAGITGMRFHDLRHTAASRLVSRHVPLAEVGKRLGHTQPATTWRYVNTDDHAARRAAAALDELYEERAAELAEQTGERVN